MVTLDITDRQVTIVSGKMYPECGISQRRRVTRSWADKGSLSNAGNAMPTNEGYCRCGTDVPKND